MTDPTDYDPLPSVEDVLRALGVDEEAIRQSAAGHTLELLAIERLVLPDPAVYTVDELAERAGMPAEQVAQLWRSLGFPDARPGERIFTDTDVDMIHTVAGLMELGVIEPELAVQMGRVIGSSLSRVASAQVDAIGVTEEDEGLPPEEFAVSAGSLLPAMPKVMDYVWRRHLQAAARRRIARTELGDDSGVQAVGFADLVGFTALSQQLDSHELAAVVDRFEAIAYDTVAVLGGRVVKMIGDEVLFLVGDAASSVEIGLSLADAYRADEELSDVRVGIASGQVLEREADVYGPVVNLASRIVGLAFPGSVVVSPDVHDALGDVEGLTWRSIRPRKLQGIGRVPLWVVERAIDGDEGRSDKRPSRSRR